MKRFASLLLLAGLAVPGLAGAQSAQDVDASAPDEFTWLERTDDPAARAWAAAQTAKAMARLKASPEFAKIQGDIRDTLAKSRPQPAYYPLGRKLLRFARDREHPLGILSVAPIDGRGEWRQLLDVAAYNQAHGTDFQIMFLDPAEQCRAPLYDRCLIPFAEGGSSLLQYREFDVESGTFVAGGFETPPIRAGVAWLDADTLVVGHALGDVPALKSGFPGAIYRWRRGTPLKESSLLFQAHPGDALISTTSVPGSSPLVISLARDYQTFEPNILDASGKVVPLALPSSLQKFGAPVAFGRYLIFQLAKAATMEGVAYAADSLIAYDPAAAEGARVSLVAAPGNGAYINDAYGGLAATRDGVAYVESVDLQKTVRLAHRNAAGKWVSKPLFRADPGVAVTIRATGAEDGVLVRMAGFLKPAEIRFLSARGKSTMIDVAAPVIDANAYVSEIRTARSKDGTIIDYYLVRPKAATGRPVPTIITAYGGYGVNLDPDYFSSGLGPALVPWLERGGAYALAAVRGGGERGSGWADAARGTRRQRSYDDFAAVAEDLVRSGFTAPRRIGAFGRSFGGLLAANVAVQRPDLFGAALVGVPIVDLFRLGRSGSDISAGQKVEVGDWDAPAQAAIMRGYSPYQNIRPGVDYPHILTVVSEKDGQVGPGHGRKFTAKLQSVGADALLLEGPTGGHGYPDQFADPEEFAAQMVFFVDALMKDDVRPQ
jgi:prolyl oligopeptidase